jgi:hypothetical protein
MPPLVAGLAVTGVMVALLPLPRSALLLAILTVIALGGPLIASTTPAMSLMTDAVEELGAALAFGSMLLNLAWAIGETVGAPAAATISHATSDAVPLALLAAIVLLTLIPVLRVGSRSGYVPAAETGSAGGASSERSALEPVGAASTRSASGGT